MYLSLDRLVYVFVLGDRREGINTAVSTDVQTVFKGKTYSQLQALHLNIETKIQAGGSNLDIGYWESLLQQVRVYMARARYVWSDSERLLPLKLLAYMWSKAARVVLK